MYALVADIERYPEFLPMCTGLRVTSRTAKDDGEELVATMSVGYKAIRESFTTRVNLKPALPGVDVAYLNGPFSHLDNRWRFIDLPEGGSEIDFYITYAFRSAMLGALVGAIFDQAFRKFAEAFEDRARVVYGAPAKTPTPAT
jgi:coenzyme Q-binding protein COQ10